MGEIRAAAAAAALAAEGAAGGAAAAAGAAPAVLPVVLLTEDHWQLLAAKRHGLPACRLTGEAGLEAAAARAAAGAPLGSAELRAALGPSATRALAASAGAARSLQAEFDGAVACLRWLLSAHAHTLCHVSSASDALLTLPADDAAPPPPAALAAARAALMAVADGPLLAAPPPAEGGEVGGEEDARVRSFLAASGAGLLSLEERLCAWERLVATRMAPSRVLQWMSS